MSAKDFQDMTDQRKMSGKKVIVSGSGTGLGRAMGTMFARHGADVAFHYSRSKEGALAAVEEAKGFGVRAVALPADFSDVQAVIEFGKQAIDFLGGVDILINNSGITMHKPFVDVTPAEFDTLYSVNVRAAFFLTQTALPTMAERRGCIINISSIHAFAGIQEHSVYAGTRGAIVAFTRQLAMELAPRKIRVNGIAPGSVVVESYYRTATEADLREAGKNIPIGTLGGPDDVANAALFLASEEAKFITGQTLIVDGGTTAFMSIGVGINDSMGPADSRGYLPGL